MAMILASKMLVDGVPADLLQRALESRVPLLYIHGTIAVSESEVMEIRNAGLSTAAFEGASHDLFADQPEEVAEFVIDWIDSLSPHYT